MTEERKKWLEEAAQKAGIVFKNSCNSSCKLWHMCQDRHYGKFCEDKIYMSPLEGAELGYKEAIAQAKEWMDSKIGGYLRLVNENGLMASTFKIAHILADFEADMNKLWEGEK